MKLKHDLVQHDHENLEIKPSKLKVSHNTEIPSFLLSLLSLHNQIPAANSKQKGGLPTAKRAACAPTEWGGTVVMDQYLSRCLVVEV